MGFSTLLDIVGSMVIGGMLMLILFRLQDSATKNSYNYGGEAIVQQNLVEVVQLLEHDFRKIGYCRDWSQIPDPSRAILTADSTSLSFLTDLDDNGTVDSLRYYLGPKSELSETPNPNDRMLYRVENGGTPVGANLGVTEFQLEYYDALNNKLTFPIQNTGQIYTMRIDLKVENTSAYDNEYTSAFWRQIRLVARNLRNR
ncbi:MAG: hypothetical protein Fur0015_10650 [Ignavibacteriales bacterium]